MRRFSIFLLFLLVGSLLAPLARAETQYYALSFDGVDDYVVTASFQQAEQMTVIAFLYYNETLSGRIVLSQGLYKQYGFYWWLDGSGWRISYNNASAISVAPYIRVTHGSHMLASVIDNINLQIKRYVDGNLVSTDAMSFAMNITTAPLYLGRYSNGGYNWQGKIYLVLIYNRALSDAEIQAIYNDPLNPPRDGLVLWLAPNSVDVTNGKWLDKSGNGNNGTIYGATAERVSIPTLKVYDANTSTLIPYSNVSLTMLYNNTTTTLIPSMPVLPYNATVTLNVSAVNYKPRLLGTWTGTDSIAVYLNPILQPSEPEIKNFNSTITPPVEFTNFDPNWLNFDQDIRNVFNGTYGLTVATLMVIGLVVASLKFHRSPMVAVTVLGVAMIYLSTWTYVNWGWLYTLAVMMISAGILRTFGKWREV